MSIGIYQGRWPEISTKNNLQVLKEGYKLPFLSEPDWYPEPNNKSAKEEPQFLREEVYKLRDKGVVSKVEKRPHCCSPLTVASRLLVSGKKKKRLCLDLSRKVNKHLKREGDVQATYNLSSAYHHIKILPEHKKIPRFFNHRRRRRRRVLSIWMHAVRTGLGDQMPGSNDQADMRSSSETRNPP